VVSHRVFATGTAARVRAVWRGRRFVVEACIRLLLVRLTLLTMPLKKQADLRSFSGSRGESRLPSREVTQVELQQIRAVSWAVTKSAVRLPIGARCLAQALVARAMLRRRGIDSTMHFGVARPDTATFEAHAWLEAAGVEVTGYPVSPQLHEIGCLQTEGARRV